MSKIRRRNQEKESYWRGHVDQQAAGDISIRAYCREHGFSQASFFAWRREIRKRDAERNHSLSGVPQAPIPLAGSHRRASQADSAIGRRTRAALVTSEPLGSSSGFGSSSRNGRPGFVGLDLVFDAPSSPVNPTLTIECPGGPVIRLREDVSAEVLERVVTVCCHRTHHATTGVAADREVRPC